jgi:UDP-N-acetylmuramate dehydrogenase
MKIYKNANLKKITSFKLGGTSEYFAYARSTRDLIQLLSWAKKNNLLFLIVGDTSNLIFSNKKFLGIIIQIKFKYKKILKEDEKYVFIDVQAGLNWDKFVEFTVQKKYWGIENLSLIPGTVGATPVQNVGAYGQEVKNVIDKVYVYDFLKEKFKYLSNKNCKFSRRKSIFNSKKLNNLIIISVVFKLSKKNNPILTRKDLILKLSTKNFKKINQKLIRNAVINLRTSGKKLAMKKDGYTVGSFFAPAIIFKKNFFYTFIKVLINLGFLPASKIFLCRILFSNNDYFKLPMNIIFNSIIYSKFETKNFKMYKNNPSTLIHNGNGDSEELFTFIKSISKYIYKMSGLICFIEPKLIGFDKSGLKYIKLNNN